MASQDSSLRTAQLAALYQRDAAVSLRPYQKALRYAEFSITIGTAIASNDDIVLGRLGVEGKVVPEQSTICGISGSVAGVFTLEKVNEAGTVAAVSGSATTATDGTPVAFARATGNALVSFDAEDYLQLTFTEATAANVQAGDVIQVLVAYLSDELN